MTMMAHNNYLDNVHGERNYVSCSKKVWLLY